MEENWFTPNLKNCVHQQKKALNKSTKFVINQKSVSTNENVISLDRKATSIWISIWKKKKKKKIKKTVSSSRNKIFLKYWPPPNCNNGFQKNVNERILFPLKGKMLPLAVIINLFKKFFQEMKKLLPMEGIFEILAQNGFH